MALLKIAFVVETKCLLLYIACTIQIVKNNSERLEVVDTSDSGGGEREYFTLGLNSGQKKR